MSVALGGLEAVVPDAVDGGILEAVADVPRGVRVEDAAGGADDDLDRDVDLDLRDASLAAYREIALAAKGLEIAHLQFVFRRLTLAVCSRVRRDGRVEIEIGLGDARLPKSAITAEQFRQAEAAARARAGVARQGRTARAR